MYGLRNVGAGLAALSPLGVEQVEDAARLVADQVATDPAVRDVSVPRTPTSIGDAQCYRDTAATLGRQLWRRTLPELDTLVSLGEQAASTLDDPWAGVTWVVVALLQSPHFVYRIELGDGQRYTGTELASRVAFLLWAGPTDAALVDAAEAGDLAPTASSSQARPSTSTPTVSRTTSMMPCCKPAPSCPSSSWRCPCRCSSCHSSS